MASEVEKQLERAKRAIEKGKPADAIAAYQAVLQAAPTTTEAMQALGDLFIQQNEPIRAANYYGLLFDRLAESRKSRERWRSTRDFCVRASSRRSGKRVTRQHCSVPE